MLTVLSNVYYIITNTFNYMTKYSVHDNIQLFSGLAINYEKTWHSLEEFLKDETKQDGWKEVSYYLSSNGNENSVIR